MKSLICLITFSLVLVACTTPPSRQTVGTLGGAAVGGLVGSLFGGGSGKIAATLGGALVGGLIGGSIGRYMDENDRRYTGYALETVPTGDAYSWNNPDSGNRYSVTPTKTYYEGDQACREFTTTATIGGKAEEVYGTACRTSDGSWKTVS
ncbi:MAG: RT0821/Lpp0805 family surface protein [Gammaproteobacteria bacterium]